MRFWSADYHNDHTKIIVYSTRPFKDVDEMRHQIITRFNAKVGKNDITYHVGDFSMKETSVKPFLDQLNGSHILIAGNHDRTHSCHKKYRKSIPKYLEDGFKEVHQELIMQLGKHQVRVNHMPYQTEKLEKYQQFRPVNDGKWLIHGHVHNMWKVKDKQINVGVDVWDYTPVSEDEILAIINVGEV